MKNKIDFRNINKKFGSKTIFSNLNFTIDKGCITSFFGPSGCGKTTLLDMISKLTPYSGSIDNLSISYVFQHSTLIKSLTAKQNLQLVTNDNQLINEYINYFDLETIIDLYPNNLSGGQKQMINFIRGISYNADILLLDEPFSSIDFDKKNKILHWLVKWQKKNKKTIIFVAHDYHDVQLISKKIIFFSSNGEIKKIVEK